MRRYIPKVYDCNGLADELGMVDLTFQEVRLFLLVKLEPGFRYAPAKAVVNLVEGGFIQVVGERPDRYSRNPVLDLQ